MNAAEHENAPFIERPQCNWHELAGRSKDYRRIELDRWGGECISDPDCPQLGGKDLMSFPVARCDVDIRAAMAGKLYRDMPRSTEAIDAETRPSPPHGTIPQPGKTKRSISDYSRTEKWSGVQVIESIRQPVREARRHGCILGKSSVHAPAGEQRSFTEVLPSCTAVPAYAAGSLQPRHADAITSRETACTCAAHHYIADNLVPRYHRSPARSKLPFHDMQVGPADPAGMNAHKQLITGRDRQRGILHHKRPHLHRRRII